MGKRGCRDTAKAPKRLNRRSKGVKMKKTSSNQGMGAGIGMCIGVALGSSLGESLFGSMGAGIAIGISLGMCIGMVFGAARDRKINEQLEKEGYTVSDVRRGDDGTVYVTVINAGGEETVLEAAPADIEAEEISAGDTVYIGEDGYIEKVETDDE